MMNFLNQTSTTIRSFKQILGFASLSIALWQCTHRQAPQTPLYEKAVYTFNEQTHASSPSSFLQVPGLDGFNFLHGTQSHQNSCPSEIHKMETNRLLIGARIANQSKFHTVRNGETLSTIAARYKLHVNILSQENGINPNKIKARQILKIPLSKKKELQAKLELASIWDHQLAHELAKQALAYGSIGLSKGHCLQGVRIALTRSLQNLGALKKNTRLHLGRSAHTFRRWAMTHSKELCERYKLVAIDPEPITLKLPGLIYVYGRGRCGFSKKHGHVETVVASEPTLVCSDNCRYTSRNNCRPDLILAPCKTCPPPPKTLLHRPGIAKSQEKASNLSLRQANHSDATI